eukprot:2035685-Pleurochrysis_carterae.AAC.2
MWWAELWAGHTSWEGSWKGIRAVESCAHQSSAFADSINEEEADEDSSSEEGEEWEEGEAREGAEEAEPDDENLGMQARSDAREKRMRSQQAAVESSAAESSVTLTAPASRPRCR